MRILTIVPEVLLAYRSKFKKMGNIKEKNTFDVLLIQTYLLVNRKKLLNTFV